MSARRRDTDVPDLSHLTVDFLARLTQRVAKVTIVRGYSVPWGAAATRDRMKVLPDLHVPDLTIIDGEMVNLAKWVVFHEEAESMAEDEFGLTYNPAHFHYGNAAEYWAVTNIGKIRWVPYQTRWNAILRISEHAPLENVHPEMDLTPYKDDDPKLYQKLLAAQNAVSRT